MAWYSAIGDIFTGGKAVAEVFTENSENKGERKHQAFLARAERDMASLQQFSAEFYARNQRTKWDSFVDGLNRLPRPLLTISILSFFVLAPLAPERFLLIAKAYELMPPGYWALLSIIIGFYFGGRMQLKAQDMVLRKDAVQAAKDLVIMKKEFREFETEMESDASKLYSVLEVQGETPENKVVKNWLESR